MSTKTKATAAKKADDKKATKMNVVEKGNKAPSILDRLEQAERQGQLARNWQRLQDYKKELDSFQFSDEESAQSLHISDGERTFTTHKPEHLEKVIGLMMELIDQKIDEIQKQIA